MDYALSEYMPILIFMLVALAISSLFVLANYLVAVNNPDPEKILHDIRQTLVGLGFHQVYSNSLQSEKEAGLTNHEPVGMMNPLNKEMGFLRTSLIPGLIKAADINIKNSTSQFRIFELENTWWMWIMLLLADDFSFYWHHRMSHQVRFLWAAHVQHHSSVNMNFAVALRQSWTEPSTNSFSIAGCPCLGFNLYTFLP